MPVPDRWVGVGLARHAAWRDEQAEMTCSDDEDVSAEESSSTQGLLMPPKEHLSVKKFRDKQKERNPHLQFPTHKDSKVLQSGKGGDFADGAVAKHSVCEEKVEVLDENPPEGAAILGPVIARRTSLCYVGVFARTPQ